MSPLLRDELCIMLIPDQVLLTRIGRSVTWRGLERRLSEKKVISCAADPAAEMQGGATQGSATRWDAAVQALEAALAGQSGVKATVILSNQFMRYALLPWSDMLGDEAEEIAYARHAFRQAFGESADGWELRISPGRPGLPQLACAVDKRLPEALRSLFGRAGVELESIQPHLMAAYNTCHASLKGNSAWFAMVEPGSLCLLLMREGKLESVRSMRMDGDGRVALPLMLERESHRAESAAAIDEVLLWAPWLSNAQLPKSKHWKFRKLEPRLPGGVARVPDVHLSVALSGVA